jgi:hypothetical protein
MPEHSALPPQVHCVASAINIDCKWSDFFEFFYLSFLLIWLSGNATLCKGSAQEREICVR